jgi:hypothetical protein
LSVLNCDSLYGLSLETFGRECDFRIPRSVSSADTGFDVIEVPRSAWIVCGMTPLLTRIASSMKCFARSPSSVVCTSQYTIHRENMSTMTYRW